MSEHNSIIHTCHFSLIKIAIAISGSLLGGVVYASCSDDYSLYSETFSLEDFSENESRDVFGYSYYDAFAGEYIASIPMRFVGPALATIRHVERGPDDSEATIYQYPNSPYAYNDDDERLYFGFRDIFVEENTIYCLDASDLYSSSAWSSIRLSVESTPVTSLIQFPQNEYDVAEGSDVTLRIELVRPLDSDFHFEVYNAYLGEAEENDFSQSSLGSYTIPRGEVAAELVIETVDDSVEETSERFTIDFWGAQSSTRLSRTTVTIIDNDQPAPINRDPLVVLGNLPTVTATQPFTHTVQASDPDNDPLSFSLEGNPSWLTINSQGVLSGTPPESGSAAGMRLIVSDNAGGETIVTFGISIQESPITNSPPTIIVSAQLPNAIIDEPYLHRPDVTDPDSTVLTYRLEGAPTWLSITNEGVLTGTPTQTALFNNIKLIVGDGENNTTSSSFSIEVVESDRVTGEGGNESSGGGSIGMTPLAFMLWFFLLNVRRKQKSMLLPSNTEIF